MWRELIQQYPEGVMVIIVLLSIAVVASVWGKEARTRKNLLGRAVLNVYYRGDTLILNRAGTIRGLQHGVVLCRDLETTQEWTVPLDVLEPIDGGLGLLWVTDGPSANRAPDQYTRTEHDLGGGQVLVHKRVRDYCLECDRRNSPEYVPGKD